MRIDADDFRRLPRVDAVNSAQAQHVLGVAYALTVTRNRAALHDLDGGGHKDNAANSCHGLREQDGRDVAVKRFVVEAPRLLIR